MDADLEYLLFIYALQNAVKHNSAPKSGAVIGTVLGKHPEFPEPGQGDWPPCREGCREGGGDGRA